MHEMAISRYGRLVTLAPRGRNLTGMFHTGLTKRRHIDYGRAATMLCSMP